MKSICYNPGGPKYKDWVWTLQRSDGGDICDIKNSPTSGQLKGYKIYAEISPEIYKLMTSEKNRIKLRQVLCDEYLNVQ